MITIKLGFVLIPIGLVLLRRLIASFPRPRGLLLASRRDRPFRRVWRRPVVADAAAVLIRLDDMLHPFLDLEAFAPRRSKLGLVWPVEAR